MHNGQVLIVVINLNFWMPKERAITFNDAYFGNDVFLIGSI